MLQFSHLKRDCNIFHFQTTRHGGVSEGLYSSMNLSEYCGDDPEKVKTNRESLCKAINIPASDLFAPNQVHESEALILDKSFLRLKNEEKTEALHGIDALITNIPNICIAVSTADCVPISLYAPDKKVIAIVHAGWRGTVLQIALKTVMKLINTFNCDPALLLAGIGASISIDKFEVGEEVVDSFRILGYDMNHIMRINKDTGKPHIDLWEANRIQLLQAGLTDSNIEIGGICTYTHNDDLFSARRSGIQSGRMLSGIIIK